MSNVQGSALRVVVRYLDKQLLKGTTRDFSPNKPEFHVHPCGDEKNAPVKITFAPLKAVFFVKTFEGNKDHVEDLTFDNARGQGRRIKVTFSDGEVITGFTVGYAPDRLGFFLLPADRASNNERIFVLTKAVTKVEWLPLKAQSSPAAVAR
jgi:hypothetical protein